MSDNIVRERKSWRAIFIAPDPHQEGNFYVIQELRGAWNVFDDGTEEWEDVESDIPPTRVLYSKLDDKGGFQPATRKPNTKPLMVTLKDIEEFVETQEVPR